MTREQAALGQLQDRFIADRMRVLGINENVAKGLWTAARARATAQLKAPGLRQKCGMDEPTPVTQYVILGVLDESDLAAIHEEILN